MALTPATLVHQSGRAGGPNICTYTSTADAIAAMVAANYFDGVADRLNVNDVIIAIDEGATVDVLVVTAISAAGVVTVVNGT